MVPHHTPLSMHVGPGALFDNTGSGRAGQQMPATHRLIVPEGLKTIEDGRSRGKREVVKHLAFL